MRIHNYGNDYAFQQKLETPIEPTPKSVENDTNTIQERGTGKVAETKQEPQVPKEEETQKSKAKGKKPKTT